MRFLHEFSRPYVQPRDGVVEAGWHAGGNLHGFLEHGYDNIAGIEINPGAIAELRRTFLTAPTSR